MQTNFLHCFYCVGVTVSPYLMSLALSDNMNWRGGYKTAFFVQSAIAVLAVMSLPIWKKVKQTQPQEEHIQVLSLSQMLKRKKIWASCGVFIGISVLESTCLIWGGTFLSESVGMPADTASTLITFYFIGMALSRLLSGVLTIKYSDWQIIFSGQAVIFMAVILLLIQNSVMAATLVMDRFFPILPILLPDYTVKNRNEYAGRPYVRSGFYVTENYCVMPTAEKSEK